MTFDLSEVAQTLSVDRTLVTAALEASIAPGLQSMLGKLYGPPARIRAALATVPGMQRAAIFGSRAERWQGTPGSAPATSTCR